MLSPGNLYTRKLIWPYYQPHKEYPTGGDWFTGYVAIGNVLVAFANIDVPGRTGHDFPNKFDKDTGLMTWFGKPNAHSAQPTFKNLLNGTTVLNMFVRWNSSDPNWYFLGQPESIVAAVDGISTNAAEATIQIDLSFNCNDAASDELFITRDEIKGTEGQRKAVLVNRYERDPQLRSEAIRIHGTTCAICCFDFETKYGALGINFCHIHHLVPLSEVEGPQSIDPKTDLLPVCPNCHAMLHKKKPPYTPEELRTLINSHKS